MFLWQIWHTRIVYVTHSEPSFFFPLRDPNIAKYHFHWHWCFKIWHCQIANILYFVEIPITPSLWSLHTCNIIHSSRKHLKMIQDLSSGIYKKLPYPLEQLKLAYRTSPQVKHFLILPKLVVFLITQPLRTVNLETTAVEMICFPFLFWDSCNFLRACLQSNTNSSCLSFNLCFLWEFQKFLMPPLSCSRLVLIFKCPFVQKSSFSGSSFGTFPANSFFHSSNYSGP